jgi:hypothetical protein
VLTSQDERAFACFLDDLFLLDDAKNSHLISATTPLNYLDAISAPKLDPKSMGQKVMEKSQSTFSSIDSLDESTEAEEDDQDMMEEGLKRNIAVN